MNKLSTLLLCAALFVTGFSQTTLAQTQPTPSMQEQYDKLHGIKPKTPTTDKSKEKTKTTTQKPEKTTAPSKPPKQAKTVEPAKPKPTKPIPAPAPAMASEGGFGVKIGLRGGVNYSSITSDAITASGITVDPLLGYHGGLVVELGGKTFSVQPEILYSQTAYKISASQAGSLLVGESRLNSVTVPLLFKVSLGNGPTKFFINAGGFGSYALSGKAKTTFSGITTTTDLKFDSGDQRLEYGAVGGAGVALGLGRAQLLIEGRYYYGLGSDGDVPAASKMFTRNIQGSVGLLIPLGGN